MKKTILFAMMAAVLGFTACSKEEPTQTETPRKGMILHATVAQPEYSKATFTDNEGVWHFDFSVDDQITVTNNIISTDYTFTYNGTDFISSDAEPTSKPARWYAYYPSREVSLVGQTGKWEDLANVYALAGSTPYFGGDVTGEDGLAITMEPAKIAFLKIVNEKGSVDINVKDGADSWVKGLAVSGSSFIPVSLFTKQTLLSTTEKGTYYIAVPANRQISIKDGDEVVKSTGASGLEAGQYYELVVEDYFEITAKQDPDHKENYYATFYSSKSAYQVPEDVTAYTGEVYGSALLLTAITSGIIPADEAVLLRLTTEDNTEVKKQIVLETTTTTATKSTDNMLLGTDEETTLGESTYSLSFGQSGVGFYLWDGIPLGANKAYLQLSASAGAKAFTFLFDDGIQ